jgi:hypothetical protein
MPNSEEKHEQAFFYHKNNILNKKEAACLKITKTIKE